MYHGAASRYNHLDSSGAGQAKIIIIALDTPEKYMELVKAVKEHMPHLQILVRSYDRPDTYEPVDLGVKSMYRETPDNSLRMGVDALCLLGHRACRSNRMARRFRCHDEKALADARSDRSRNITVAR